MTMDYVKFAEQVKAKFFELMSDDQDGWTLAKTSDDAKVWSRPSTEMKGNILKGEALVEATPKQLFDFVHPMKPYRVKWDTFLDFLKVGEEFAPGVYLVYHVTKPVMKIISPRESLDVAIFGETDECFFVAAAAVEHPSFPPNSKYVHVKQYPCGFKIFKDSGEPGKTRFRMLFNVDLQMNALTAFVAEQLKPKLMIDEVEHIRHGLKTIPYTPDADLAPGQVEPSIAKEPSTTTTKSPLKSSSPVKPVSSPVKPVSSPAKAASAVVMSNGKNNQEAGESEQDDEPEEQEDQLAGKLHDVDLGSPGSAHSGSTGSGGSTSSSPSGSSVTASEESGCGSTPSSPVSPYKPAE